MTKLNRVVVIGSGNIGTDLCERLLLQDQLELVAFIGRRRDSPGLLRLANKGVHVEWGGKQSLIDLCDHYDGVFDATSAPDHVRHWDALRKINKWAIDLTPSRVGKPLVPVLTDQVPAMNFDGGRSVNFSMVSCGGQSSAPLLYALTQSSRGVREVEVSSSIAALSAGPATRRNIDEYVDATEQLAAQVSGCDNSKAILVLNPAEPAVMMRTSVHVLADHYDLESMKSMCIAIEESVQQYVPGYEIVVWPHYTASGTVSATVKVTGAGHYLPEYAGNLDIINAAAVETAIRLVKSNHEATVNPDGR